MGRHPLAEEAAAQGLRGSQGCGKMAIYLASERRSQFCAAFIQSRAGLL
jgi:hypothetical protein